MSVHERTDPRSLWPVRNSPQFVHGLCNFHRKIHRQTFDFWQQLKSVDDSDVKHEIQLYVHPTRHQR
jgi:hypothetical protein